MFALAPLKLLVEALTDQASPRQWAGGFALGMIAGLVPKENLTAVVLMTLLCLLRVNLTAGLLGAFVFSWVGLVTDPLSHRIGLGLLTADSFEPAWTWLFNQPVVPWTDLNNTVVLGSLVLGITWSYPVYRLAAPLFARALPRIGAKLQRFKVVQILTGVELAGKLGAA